jgi:hypothetical protein
VKGRISRLVMLAGVVIGFAACGGGGGGDSGSAATDPKFSALMSFDLSNSILTGQTLDDGTRNCDPETTAISLVRTFYTSETGFGFINFNLTGRFRLPRAASCSTVGMTGKINSATFIYDSSTVYTLNDLNIDATVLGGGWQSFWSAVLAQTGKLINTRPTSQTISCEDGFGRPIEISLSASGDIAGSVKRCF